MNFHEILICGSCFSYGHLHRWDLQDNSHGERKMNRIKTVQAETSISSLSLWRLGTLLEQLEEKIGWISQGTTRDAVIVDWRHPGKGWVIHN